MLTSLEHLNPSSHSLCNFQILIQRKASYKTPLNVLSVPSSRSNAEYDKAAFQSVKSSRFQSPSSSVFQSEVAGGVDATVGVVIPLRTCSKLLLGNVVLWRAANPAVVSVLLTLLLAIHPPRQQRQYTDENSSTDSTNHATDDALAGR